MSTSRLAGRFPPVQGSRATMGGRTLWERLERFSPRQGWVTFALLVAPLLVVAESVTAADWVETPGLTRVLLLGSIVGLALARVKGPAALLHLLALAIGFAVVVWYTSSLIEGQPLVERVQEMWRRLQVWYEAASSGGISTDLIPFTVGILASGWLLGYFSAWFVFRSSNVWVALVLAGVAMLTNLSFLPDKFTFRFFIFMFFAMLLVVWISVFQRHEGWRKGGIQFDSFGRWSVLHATVWFSVAVMLIAFLLPMNATKVRSMSKIWNKGRAPVERLEDEFARLFSPIPARKNLSGRFFGTTLPFLGTISFDGEVVFWADSTHPSYWLSQTYSEYTSKGWIAGKSEPLKFGPNTLPPPHGDMLKREPVDQSIQISFTTSDFLSGGNLDQVSRKAELKTLAPKEFEIDLRDSSNDHLLGEDIGRLAGELRVMLDPPPDEFIESYISRILPSDLVLMSVTHNSEAKDRSVLEKITLARKAPVTPEVVSWKFTERLQPDQVYSMVSFVSTASDDDLRKAGTEYSGFIRDHYLQLPDTLPQRVQDLGRQLTREAETPLDKARAIEEYLRGPDFTYSQKINIPPEGSDGVDYFLLETKIGYSDYFASSMTVMLRAVGVPARMAAGYAPGEVDPKSGRTFVRDSDSHGWMQVYFPNYGWIDFEPTPKWPVSQRVGAADADSEADLSFLGDSIEEFRDAEDIFEALDPVESAEASAGEVAAFRFGKLAVLVGAALGGVASLWFVLYTVWNRGLAGATSGERAYTKMSRLGALAGVRRRGYQTPLEYGEVLGGVIPSIASTSRRIGWAFAGDRYGGRGPVEEDQEGLEQAWRSIRGSLVARALRRLIPKGGRPQE